MILWIDKTPQEVCVTSLKRKATVLDGENAGRLKDGTMVRDIKGTFYNYTMTVEETPNTSEAYHDLFQNLTAPKDFHKFSLPFGQDFLSFDGYVANVSDKLIMDRGSTRLWGDMNVTITSKAPQRYFGEQWSVQGGSGNRTFIIDDKAFNVQILDLQRSASILDGENAGRSESAIMKRDIIGTYYNYTLKLGTSELMTKEYDRLYYILTAPEDKHSITISYGQSTLTFDAYISGAEDELKFKKNRNTLWGDLSVTFTAISPARRPL